MTLLVPHTKNLSSIQRTCKHPYSNNRAYDGRNYQTMVPLDMEEKIGHEELTVHEAPDETAIFHCFFPAC